jgi:ubiquinone/menaquinone biosynthesis C-methylase UbiE
VPSPLARKWDRASRVYDRQTRADDYRFGAAKRRLFARMQGRCLMLATGTGGDFHHFPPGLDVVAIDISAGMLERARPRAAEYPGRLTLARMDARRLAFPDATFDTVVSVCTFCSVPEPVRGLRELRRVLSPSGRILLFEHVRSRWTPIAVMQDLLTPITRRFGPDMNRDTATNVARAGFRIVREESVYLDVVWAWEAEPA